MALKIYRRHRKECEAGRIDTKSTQQLGPGCYMAGQPDLFTA
jgi:hypothetical protein